MKRILLHLLFCLMPFTVMAEGQVKVIDGRFYRDGEPYYYIGTNFWYGPILASEGQGGNFDRLTKELDTLKALGLNNLRVLVGADAGTVNANTVKPYLQNRSGVLNDTLLVGLDRFLGELRKRDMVCVLYLTNAWDWSGGYGYYLREVGLGDSPYSGGNGYNSYCKYASQFIGNKKAIALFHDHIKRIVGRKNSLTGKPYSEDPAIMAWQICNEPRAFGADKQTFAKFIHETAALIKSIDPNHLVSTGSEGSIGCGNDMELCKQIHMDDPIDYLTIHIWPMNWQWCAKGRLTDDLPHVYQKAGAYIADHLRVAQKMGKPLVIEEFGYPRDGHSYRVTSGTYARDAFYGYIFSQVRTASKQRLALMGCNFWGWGGLGRPNQEEWAAGDDYLCDPPHEPQGWYSVYDTDSTTISLIREEAEYYQ